MKTIHHKRKPCGNSGSGGPEGTPESIDAGMRFLEVLIDNPVTTLLHYSRKVVRLAFRETPLTTQIFHFRRLPCPRNAPLAALRPHRKTAALRPHIRRTVPICVLSPLPMAASVALRAAPTPNLFRINTYKNAPKMRL